MSDKHSEFQEIFEEMVPGVGALLSIIPRTKAYRYDIWGNWALRLRLDLLADAKRIRTGECAAFASSVFGSLVALCHPKACGRAAFAVAIWAALRLIITQPWRECRQAKEFISSVHGDELLEFYNGAWFQIEMKTVKAALIRGGCHTLSLPVMCTPSLSNALDLTPDTQLVLRIVDELSRGEK